MKKILTSLLFMSFAFGVTAQSGNTRETINRTDALICMVTTDSTSTQNEIVWTSSLIPEAVTVVIFRLDTSGKYIEIGQQAAKDGVYIDKRPNSSDSITSSHSYYIQYLDKAQKKSQQSLSHKSIFIDGNGKGEFHWNAYEIAPRDSNGKVIYTLWRQAKGEAAKVLLKTEDTKADDPDIKDHLDKGTLWWITLDNFPCDGGKTRTKSNQSNE